LLILHHTRHQPPSTPFPYTTLFRSQVPGHRPATPGGTGRLSSPERRRREPPVSTLWPLPPAPFAPPTPPSQPRRSGRRMGSFPSDRKSTRLNSSHQIISYAVFCLKK